MNPDLSAEFHLSSSSLPLVGFATAVPDARLNLDEVLRTGEETVLLCWAEVESFDPVEAALDADASIASWSLLEAAGNRRLYPNMAQSKSHDPDTLQRRLQSQLPSEWGVRVLPDPTPDGTTRSDVSPPQEGPYRRPLDLDRCLDRVVVKAHQYVNTGQFFDA